MSLSSIDRLILSRILSSQTVYSSEVTFSTLLALCEGNPLITSGFFPQRSSNKELWWFFCCQQNVDQTGKLMVTWDSMILMRHHSNVVANVCGNLIIFLHPISAKIIVADIFKSFTHGLFCIYTKDADIQEQNNNTVETLYNTINFCWSTHKRHSIARPKGRGMGCLLWVQRATYFVDLAILSSIKYLL